MAFADSMTSLFYFVFSLLPAASLTVRRVKKYSYGRVTPLKKTLPRQTKLICLPWHHFEMLLELLSRLLSSGFTEETEIHTAVGTMLQEPGVTFKTVGGSVFQDKETTFRPDL